MHVAKAPQVTPPDGGSSAKNAGGELIERLYRTHSERLVRHLTDMLGSRDLAREAAQDAFERLYSKYLPEQMRHPRAALFKTGERCALMQLRRRRLEYRRLGRSVTMSEDEVAAMPDSFAGPDRQAMLDQLGVHVAAVVIELRPTLRSVFVMAHVQGKPRSEIAAALGISEKRVDKRMTKALRTCRERLLARGIDLLSALGLAAAVPFCCLLGMH